VNILLAKTQNMYYSINRKLIVTAFLLLAISLTTYHPNIYAEVLFQSAEEYRTQGYEEQQKGHFDKALTNYSKAVSLGLENAKVYNDVGVVYEQLGIPDRAEQFYLKAIKQDKDYLPPYTNLAYLYQSIGNTQKAIFYFQERLERATDGDPWKEKVQQELFKISPEWKNQMIGDQLKKLDEELAKKALREAEEELSLQMSRAENHFQQAQQFLTDGNYEEAVLELDRALVATPHNPKILKAREDAIYQQGVEDIKRRTDNAIRKLDAGDVESAKKEFQQILATIPKESNQKSE